MYFNNWLHFYVPDNKASQAKLSNQNSSPILKSVNTLYLQVLFL